MQPRLLGFSFTYRRFGNTLTITSCPVRHDLHRHSWTCTARELRQQRRNSETLPEKRPPLFPAGSAVEIPVSQSQHHVGRKRLRQGLNLESLGGAGGAAKAARSSAHAEMHIKAMALTTSHIVSVPISCPSLGYSSLSCKTAEMSPKILFLQRWEKFILLKLLLLRLLRILFGCSISNNWCTQTALARNPSRSRIFSYT